MNAAEMKAQLASIRYQHTGEVALHDEAGQDRSRCRTCFLIDTIDTMIARRWDPTTGGPALGDYTPEGRSGSSDVRNGDHFAAAKADRILTPELMAEIGATFDDELIEVRRIVTSDHKLMLVVGPFTGSTGTGGVSYNEDERRKLLAFVQRFAGAPVDGETVAGWHEEAESLVAEFEGLPL